MTVSVDPAKEQVVVAQVGDGAGEGPGVGVTTEITKDGHPPVNVQFGFAQVGFGELVPVPPSEVGTGVVITPLGGVKNVVLPVNVLLPPIF